MIQFPDIDPVILPLGPLAISWYSLSYVVGILISWAYCVRLINDFSKEQKNSPSAKNMDDFISWVVIGIILGGRLGYVLFYDPVKYLSDPVEILKTYKGGMSFHGGMVGFIISSYWFSRRNNINVWTLTDICAAAAPVALFLGRIANFINAELYGRVTNVPWAVIFPYSDGMPRHPSQIYEALLEGMVTFFILWYLIYCKNALKSKGMVSGVFLICYSVFRIFVEFFREPDYQLGYIVQYFTMGQILCLPMLCIGLALFIKSKK
ncbi:MAG: hypothetical protein DGJ47_000919 [Rickettsiaceae bacterium]